MATGESSKTVLIPVGGSSLEGELVIPPRCLGVVLFAHGSGSGRHSPRNQFVARTLQEHAIGTLLFDLLTRKEEREDAISGQLRFDIELLARRLGAAAAWYHQTDRPSSLGYFGSSTGAGAALVAAARSSIPIAALVSRGGRPDLAGSALPHVTSPTLLLVGSKDTAVIELNRRASEVMNCPRELRLIPGATHLFEEPGTLELVADMAAAWFRQHFERRDS
jgi:pimeloyl-ACP methyl ester carboxylesterase